MLIKMKKIKVKILNNNCKVPMYAYDSDSGCDVYAAETVTLKQFETVKIPTGVCLQIPEGYEVQVRPKSGLSSKGILVYFGTVDNNYTGEIQVNVCKLSPGEHTFNKGDKIAQLVFCEGIVHAEFEHVSKLENTDRGNNGFGSTGK
jgi:dUTP pyrophosphatase